VRHLVPIGFSLSLAACATTPVAFDDAVDDSVRAGDNPVLTGEEFELSIGERARIDGTAISIEFEAVTEDSRCAKGVVCVWEGNARARFLLREDVHDEYVELNTSNRFDTRRTIGPGSLVMRGLDPRPPVADPRQYVVTLFIEPGP